MICSELTTFAVESPTVLWNPTMAVGCDLLRINYLCGRITNAPTSKLSVERVVICSELTTFAVESPTIRTPGRKRASCDLLRINYLCGRITNFIGSRRWAAISCDLLRINYLCGRITNPRTRCRLTVAVVICSELTTFAVESPTSSRSE